jgi:tetratricopeptide (TPR) repeat protein
LSVTSKNFLIAHNLCHHYLFAGRLDEAEPLCRQSLEANPNHVNAKNTLAMLQLQKGQLAESERGFREVLARQPDFMPAYGNLAAVLMLRQNPEEAEKLLEQATILGEGNVDRSAWIEPVKNLADLYASQRKFDKAAENYARAIYLSPQRADLRIGIASAQFETKKYDEALANIQAAMTVEANNADAFNLAGKIFAAREMPDDAAKMFERAIAIRPNFGEARENLSKLKGGMKK